MRQMNIGYEKIFYLSGNSYDTSLPFDIEACGQTIPNGSYVVERIRTGENIERVSVFEYVISGKGYIECCGKKYTVGAGDFYYLDRYHSHKYYSDKNEPFSKIWINVRGRFPEAMLDVYSINDPIVIEKLDVYDVFRSISEQVGVINETNRDEVFSNVAVLLTTLIIKVGNRIRSKNLNCGLPYQIKSIIDNSSNFDIGLEQIEKKLYLSKSYIIHLFSKEFGITPKQYIMQKRIGAAKVLLCGSRSELSDISEQLGFSSVQHFSSSFKKYTGKTPDAFRRNQQYNR
ncbi:MAG: AraC family transcriptional regulator [Clostridia bacterium]|nr:AraC family transcriptional regulator [Clostridia bacterium]